jgi:pyrroline-5-carboxylate reductase
MSSQIAFLGAGRMASAMVDGLLAKGTPKFSLICLSGSGKTADALAARTGILATADLAGLLRDADALVLSCKPQQLAGLDPRLAELTADKLVLSVLAGKRLARLAQVFPQARNLVRSMPNTPGQIGAGITGWNALNPLSPSDQSLVDKILGAMGKTVAVEESQLDAVTAVSGSGPAYVFEFAAALREAGVSAGLSREAAYQLAVETILGAAKLMAQSPADAETLRNQVTSPNGTTYAGLMRMEARDFRGIIQETVAAAKARSEELSRD